MEPPLPPYCFACKNRHPCDDPHVYLRDVKPIQLVVSRLEEESILPSSSMGSVQNLLCEEECCICLDEDLSNSPFKVSLGCGHSFCGGCLTSYVTSPSQTQNIHKDQSLRTFSLGNPCPLCRSPLSGDLTPQGAHRMGFTDSEGNCTLPVVCPGCGDVFPFHSDGEGGLGDHTCLFSPLDLAIRASALLSRNPKAALRYLHSACSLAPRIGDLWFDSGVALQGLNRHRQAIRAFEMATQCGGLGNYDISVPCSFQKARGSGNSLLPQHLAMALQVLGDHKAARDILLPAIEQDQNNPHPRNMLACSVQETDGPEAAVPLYEISMALDTRWRLPARNAFKAKRLAALQEVDRRRANRDSSSSEVMRKAMTSSGFDEPTGGSSRRSKKSLSIRTLSASSSRGLCSPSGSRASLSPPSCRTRTSESRPTFLRDQRDGQRLRGSRSPMLRSLSSFFGIKNNNPSPVSPPTTLHRRANTPTSINIEQLPTEDGSSRWSWIPGNRRRRSRSTSGIVEEAHSLSTRILGPLSPHTTMLSPNVPFVAASQSPHTLHAPVMLPLAASGEGDIDQDVGGGGRRRGGRLSPPTPETRRSLFSPPFPTRSPSRSIRPLSQSRTTGNLARGLETGSWDGRGETSLPPLLPVAATHSHPPTTSSREVLSQQGHQKEALSSLSPPVVSLLHAASALHHCEVQISSPNETKIGKRKCSRDVRRVGKLHSEVISQLGGFQKKAEIKAVSLEEALRAWTDNQRKTAKQKLRPQLYCRPPFLIPATAPSCYDSPASGYASALKSPPTEAWAPPLIHLPSMPQSSSLINHVGYMMMNEFRETKRGRSRSSDSSGRGYLYDTCAYALTQAGLLEDARCAYIHALMHAPNSERVARGLVLVLQAIGQHQEALPLCRSLCGSTPRFHSLRGARSSPPGVSSTMAAPMVGGFLVDGEGSDLDSEGDSPAQVAPQDAWALAFVILATIPEGLASSIGTISREKVGCIAEETFQIAEMPMPLMELEWALELAKKGWASTPHARVNKLASAAWLARIRGDPETAAWALISASDRPGEECSWCATHSPNPNVNSGRVKECPACGQETTCPPLECPSTFPVALSIHSAGVELLTVGIWAFRSLELLDDAARLAKLTLSLTQHGTAFASPSCPPPPSGVLVSLPFHKFVKQAPSVVSVSSPRVCEARELSRDSGGCTYSPSRRLEGGTHSALGGIQSLRAAHEVQLCLKQLRARSETLQTFCKGPSSALPLPLPALGKTPSGSSSEPRSPLSY